MTHDIDHQAVAWQFHSDWIYGEDRRLTWKGLASLNRWDFALVVSLLRPLLEEEGPGCWKNFEDLILARADRAAEKREERGAS
jgi:hypothetical protein